MAFDYDETNPVGSSFIADFPGNEQAARLAVLSSVNVDHYAETDGFHRRVTMPPLGVKPVSQSTAGFLYSKVISAKTELFYEDDAGLEIQLTDVGSASPDKVAKAGDTMTGNLTMNSGKILMQGTSVLRFLNTLAVQGRDAANLNWRNLLQVDSSDVTEIGDQSLAGGLRLNADGIDEATVDYGDGGKKVWHAGHFAAAPLLNTFYESDEISFTWAGSGAKYTTAHGLAAKPTLWKAVLLCTSAENGYDTGDEIPLGEVFVPGSPGAITVGVDATNFYHRLSDNKAQVLGTTGGNVNLEDDKWVIVFRAWYAS